MKKNNIFILAIIFLLSSCMGGGNTMQSSGRPGKLYETFYVKNGVTQYFIKPLKAKSKTSTFKMDFTLRNNIKSEGIIVCNFSVLSKNPIKKIESASFVCDEKTISLKDLDKIFIEKEGKDSYHLRYTSNISFKDFSTISKGENISISFDNMTNTFSKGTVKKLHKINEYIIEVIELNMEEE